MKKQWQLYIGLLISVVALVLAVRQVDPAQIVETLARAEYIYLLPAFVVFEACMLARAFRWRLLLEERASLISCFWITNIGYLVSNVLPFRLGDPARALVIGRQGRVSPAAALSTVVVERVLDMLSIVALLAVVAPFVGEVGDTALAGIVGGGMGVIALLVLLALAFRPSWGKALGRCFLRRVPNGERWEETLDSLIDGLAPLRSGRRGMAILACSALVWALVVIFYWMMLRAFMLRPPILAAPFLVCVLGLGMAIPSSPGAIGLFHAVARYGLTIPFDVSVDLAVAIAFAIHTYQYILGCTFGLIGLGRESLSLGWLRARAVVEGETALQLDEETM
ncbi:MAG TPA: flippase-like domain-containing protein [Chloroflexi bacterium]|nr:flippase-like domain-containing protein [Chloroflexota bacterium]